MTDEQAKELATQEIISEALPALRATFYDWVKNKLRAGSILTGAEMIAAIGKASISYGMIAVLKPHGFSKEQVKTIAVDCLNELDRLIEEHKQL
ncbi:MAG: hypothetical protein KDA57_22185 [Planctomycetales bacterium]|nr:hypothetical protein [Planctomycetales bacterium]